MNMVIFGFHELTALRIKIQIYFQRPMELASVRLQNMMDILPSWDKLIPSNLNLITQQGGAYVINDEGQVIFEHRDTGILKYVNVEKALRAAGINLI